MRKLFTLSIVILLTFSVFAQTPQKISYQAVIRNSSNVLVISSPVGMRVSILQGSPTGTEVYREIYNPNPQTNANGLVTIEIGVGTALTGTFAGIDWSAGTYFIKTETDPTGGTDYTITGTSQLLSVPYALYAKTAENVSGTITETDPVFTGSQAHNITAGDITNLGKLSGVNTGDQDGSETKVASGTNITVTGSGTTGNPYIINATGAKTHAIGDSFQGGIIFWLDATGQHGLMAATFDQSTGVIWNNGIYRYTGARSDGVYAGAMNTALAVATQIGDNQSAVDFAAKICADYSSIGDGGTWGGWYLPSKYELETLLYPQKDVVGNFSGDYYWSSSESGLITALAFWFTNAIQVDRDKGFLGSVRAIRAF